MPNWSSGNIRIRGTQGNILNFVRNGISYCYYGETAEGKRENIQTPVDVEFNDYKDWGEVVIYPTVENRNGWYYIDDTKRAFIENVNTEISSIFFGKYRDNENWIIIFDEFKQAWGIRPEDFEELSKKYNVDFRIFCWEQGMQFSEELEVVRGQPTKYFSKQYNDWDWDCPMPFLGG